MTTRWPRRCRVLAAEADGVEVILHCFSAPPERVAEAAANGWYCSFAGNVTYPKAEELREAARLVPDELILVETDSPFLAPQSRRGKRNEPAFVVETAREVAAARGVSYEELEALVEANAAAGVPVVRLGQNFLADTEPAGCDRPRGRARAERRGARGRRRRGRPQRAARGRAARPCT